MFRAGLLVFLVVMTVQPRKEALAAAAPGRTATQLLLEDRISGNDEAPPDHRTLCLLLGEDQEECNKKLALLHELKLAEKEDNSKNGATENRRTTLPSQCSSPFCSMKILSDFLRDEKSEEDRVGKRQRRPGDEAAFYSGW